MTPVPDLASKLKRAKRTVREYELGTLKAKVIYLFSAEKRETHSSHLMEIKVKPVSIQKGCIVMPCYYQINELGTVISVGEKVPKPVEMERKITRVVFASTRPGFIKKGDLLGAVVVRVAEPKS